MAAPLIAGLLGAGWLLGNDRYQRAQADQGQARRAEQVRSLLGTRGRELAGPTRSGDPLMGRGTGLLGGELSPEEFHGGLLAIPGYEEIGARGLMASTGITAADAPAAVREWQYYSSLEPDQQAQYLRMKRADPTFRMGDVTMYGNPVAGTAAPFVAEGVPGSTQPVIQGALATQQAQRE